MANDDRRAAVPLRVRDNKNQLRDVTFLPGEAVDQFYRHGRTARFCKGETILQCGDEGTCMMLTPSSKAKPN